MGMSDAATVGQEYTGYASGNLGEAPPASGAGALHAGENAGGEDATSCNGAEAIGSKLPSTSEDVGGGAGCSCNLGGAGVASPPPSSAAESGAWGGMPAEGGAGSGIVAAQGPE